DHSISGADTASARESIPHVEECSVAINANSSMAWLIVRIRQRIDGTITINWWIITIIRLLAVGSSQPHDRLTDSLVAGDVLRWIDDLEIDPLHGIKTQKLGLSLPLLSQPKQRY